jgi:hypothetical protein
MLGSGPGGGCAPATADPHTTITHEAAAIAFVASQTTS